MWDRFHLEDSPSNSQINYSGSFMFYCTMFTSCQAKKKKTFSVNQTVSARLTSQWCADRRGEMFNFLILSEREVILLFYYYFSIF